MYSANSGYFPRNPLNTHSEISNAPVLDRNSSLLHFSKNPFTRSEFSVAWGPRLAALKQHRAALYLFRLNKILPLQTRSVSAKVWSDRRARASARLEKERQRSFLRWGPSGFLAAMRVWQREMIWE
ncbi:hypothetical protein MIMGU_mgv1a020043mg [Erythranthe guttata]|uniref:Uncharacterized protein n=1 Tax=Erythranthe guttata TaxID=4155 RepID=A0A022RM41_ERYGU|nr:hypothetical protein MIMGU_mgv1a020043mg [Erythranthe guttata]